MNETKVCPDCGRDLPLASFGDNKSRPDGKAFYCLDCFGTRAVASYRRRREAAGFVVRETPAVPDGHKWCPACRQVRAVTEFHRAARQSGGLASYCKTCKRERDEARRLMRLYGLSARALNEMREAQGGRCYLCRTRPAEHVDHDHVSRRVRALLCFRCNTGLGQFDDRPDLLRAAADYVERFSVQRVREAPGVYRLVPPREPGVPPVADLAPLLAGRRDR